MNSIEVRSMLESGRNPIELAVYGICDSVGDEEYAYYACARVNSPSRDKPLLPKDYQRAARNSAIGYKYIEWTMRKLYTVLPKLLEESPNIEYVALDVSLAGMKLPGTMSIMEKYIKLDRSIREKICLIFPSLIMTSNSKETYSGLNKFKELGFKLAIGDYGGVDCPIVRLSELPTDLLFIDSMVAEAAIAEDSPYRGIISFANNMNKKTVLPLDMPEDELTRLAAECGCVGYMSYSVSRIIN